MEKRWYESLTGAFGTSGLPRPWLPVGRTVDMEVHAPPGGVKEGPA